MIEQQNSFIKNSVCRTFTLLWALAIFWFYLGNLVNFHQNRIWGKVLIPTCFTHSSANSKDFHFFQKANDDFSSESVGDDFNAPEVSINNYTAYLPIEIENEIFISDETAKSSVLEGEKRLRAPPVA